MSRAELRRRLWLAYRRGQLGPFAYAALALTCWQRETRSNN